MLRRGTFPILAWLAWVAISGAAFAQPATLTRALPTQRLLERYGLVRMWSGQAEMNTSRETVRHLVTDEQVVMVHSTGGILTVFEGETGRRLWSALVGRPDDPAFEPIANDELVLIASGVRLFAFDKWTGRPVWTITVPGQPSASPAVDETQIYIGCLDGSMYAFDLKRIHKLYQQGRLPQWSQQALVWFHKTNGRISAPPVPTGATIKFASHNRSLYSLTRDQHAVRFQLETGAAIAAPIAFRQGTIFLVSEDFKLYAINSDNGRLRWEPYVTGLPIRRPPYVIGEAAYVFPDRGGMHAVSVDDGRQLWWRPHVEDFISGSRTRLYTSDGQGNLIVMARNNGAPLGVLPLRNFTVRHGNNHTDRLFLSTPSGLVLALREREQQFPIYHLFPERQPILPDFAPDEPEGEAEAEFEAFP